MERGENFAGNDADGEWLPYIGSFGQGDQRGPPLVADIEALLQPYRQQPLVHLYGYLRIYRYLHRSYPDTYLFTAPAFEPAASTTSSNDTSLTPNERALAQLNSNSAIITTLLQWITQSLWKMISNALSSSPTVSATDIERAMLVCHDMTFELKHLFHILIARDHTSMSANETTNLGVAYSLYFIALTNLNVRLPVDLAFTIHRGDSTSADNAPGTQLPWITRATAWHAAPPYSPIPSLISTLEADKISLIGSDNIYAALN